MVNTIRHPAPSATASTTNIRTTAMNMIEEGLSDNDLACAANCITSAELVAGTYIRRDQVPRCMVVFIAVIAPFHEYLQLLKLLRDSGIAHAITRRVERPLTAVSVLSAKESD
ncbi:hypothetical protein EDB87DRAFT_1835892 [Lactarius vividus]|nr:hypothetical protein EDB87DRAFT_1835892 [Lactarius vividus]